MKIKLGYVKQDGFVARYAIRFDNELVLYTDKVLWTGLKEKRMLLLEVIDHLESLGFEIIDIHLIREQS